jgi:hypothetical protein
MSARMIRAEALKISKNRAVVITAILMTLGVGVLIMVIPELYRIGRTGVAIVGGQRGLQRGAITDAFLGSIAAMIVGSLVGTGDLSAGVFRDLVATGRSRWALFAAKVPGAFVFWIPLISFGWIVICLLDVWFSFHGSAPLRSGLPGPCAGQLGLGLRGGPGPNCAFFSGATPPFSQFVNWYLWVLLYTGFILLVAIGLSSWVGSRAITLGILIPFQLFVAPILSSISQLGGVRQVLYPQSMGLIAPDVGGQGVPIRHLIGGQTITTSLAMAWFVLALWVVALLGAGAFRNARRDA